ncbi:hypothetical protein M3Y96_00426700 [Aphelenchoides besseyi]|nr:hypothetical protein M3Y96_00426700 [Aphelenchoides besseyi]
MVRPTNGRRRLPLTRRVVIDKKKLVNDGRRDWRCRSNAVTDEQRNCSLMFATKNELYEHMVAEPSACVPKHWSTSPATRRLIKLGLLTEQQCAEYRPNYTFDPELYDSDGNRIASMTDEVTMVDARSPAAVFARSFVDILSSSGFVPRSPLVGLKSEVVSQPDEEQHQPLSVDQPPPPVDKSTHPNFFASDKQNKRPNNYYVQRPDDKRYYCSDHPTEYTLSNCTYNARNIISGKFIKTRKDDDVSPTIPRTQHHYSRSSTIKKLIGLSTKKSCRRRVNIRNSSTYWLVMGDLGISTRCVETLLTSTAKIIRPNLRLSVREF